MEIENLANIAWGVIGIAGVLSTLIQITPIQINPWSALFHWIGSRLNADTMKELEAIKKEQCEIRDKLDEHIRIDDMRAADEYRRQILSFNASLLKNAAHTKEEFTEILGVIDAYEKYCHEHDGYKNGRAVHAIAHIGKVYDERLEKRDFLQN